MNNGFHTYWHYTSNGANSLPPEHESTAYFAYKQGREDGTKMVLKILIEAYPELLEDSDDI